MVGYIQSMVGSCTDNMLMGFVLFSIFLEDNTQPKLFQ